ncbi:MAG: hypothetical protein O2861_16115 [Proteobacteria bacterium]|nr:hypothetical protein [Pseudomonadota bacterium]
MLKNSLKLLTSLTLALFIVGQSSSQDADKQLDISAELFKCLTDMARAGSGAFFVDNVLGDLDATLVVANSETGGSYPPGSVIALVPTEAMVKHETGWNPATNDWEFFELNVSEAGSEINVRGTTSVVNRFGGNCFDCHKLATPQWDLVCGTDHGCAPLPIPRETIVNIQNTDPRCVRPGGAE